MVLIGVDQINSTKYMRYADLENAAVRLAKVQVFVSRAASRGREGDSVGLSARPSTLARKRHATEVFPLWQCSKRGAPSSWRLTCTVALAASWALRSDFGLVRPPPRQRRRPPEPQRELPPRPYSTFQHCFRTHGKAGWNLHGPAEPKAKLCSTAYRSDLPPPQPTLWQNSHVHFLAGDLLL